MADRRVIIVGGGAAGFFAAITCAEMAPDVRITLFEKGRRFLDKVRVSGGGRCNVTHACFDPRELIQRYPRGGRELLGPFHRFQPRDTVEWFRQHGVSLKTEADGRMFPVTDLSSSIVDCLMDAARSAGVDCRVNSGVQTVKCSDGEFTLGMADGTECKCDRMLLATGGVRGEWGRGVIEALGHTLETPVPSLFTFSVDTVWVPELSGLTIPQVEVAVPGTELSETGPLLFTHWGLSGPAILRLSAWGARQLHDVDYRFPLRINWQPTLDADGIAALCKTKRQSDGARQLANSPLASLPARLWRRLVQAAGVSPETKWAALSRASQQQLMEQLTRTELQVTGKSLNKEEFVTCGGVRLIEVNFKTMESRICPGLHFAGELLDIDGITGGFNFQAAWTTGWIAGHAMAES